MSAIEENLLNLISSNVSANNKQIESKVKTSKVSPDLVNRTIGASRYPLGYVGSLFGQGVFAVHASPFLVGRIAAWNGGGMLARLGAIATIKPIVPYVCLAGSGIGGLAFGIVLPFALNAAYNTGKDLLTSKKVEQQI